MHRVTRRSGARKVAGETRGAVFRGRTHTLASCRIEHPGQDILASPAHPLDETSHVQVELTTPSSTTTSVAPATSSTNAVKQTRSLLELLLPDKCSRIVLVAPTPALDHAGGIHCVGEGSSLDRIFQRLLLQMDSHQFKHFRFRQTLELPPPPPCRTLHRFQSSSGLIALPVFVAQSPHPAGGLLVVMAKAPIPDRRLGAGSSPRKGRSQPSGGGIEIAVLDRLARDDSEQKGSAGGRGQEGNGIRRPPITRRVTLAPTRVVRGHHVGFELDRGDLGTASRKHMPPTFPGAPRRRSRVIASGRGSASISAHERTRPLTELPGR